jgi:hypothetical protein
MSSPLLLLFITLFYPYIKFLCFLQGTGTCTNTYISPWLYRIVGASTSSHGELYSPSTTTHHKDWFSLAVQGKVHISTVRQGLLAIHFAVCLYYIILGLSAMSLSACTMLQTKISMRNRITKQISS